jgi:hypothetical protein
MQQAFEKLNGHLRCIDAGGLEYDPLQARHYCD